MTTFIHKYIYMTTFIHKYIYMTTFIHKIYLYDNIHS